MRVPAVWALIRDLASAREAAGMSIADAPDRAALSPSTITRLEAGQVKRTTVDVLERYARAVGRELWLSVTPAAK